MIIFKDKRKKRTCDKKHYQWYGFGQTRVYAKCK